MDDGGKDDGRSSGHELLDHTSEIVVRLHAPSFPELIMEAGRAFAGLVPAGVEGREARDTREVTLEGADPAAMLVDWMNELVFLAEAERWIPSDVSVHEERGAPAEARSTTAPVEAAPPLRIRARGLILDRPFVFVKAATLHGVAVRRGPNGIEAEVTLDV